MRSRQVTKKNTLLVVLIMLVVVFGFVTSSYSAVLTSSDQKANLFVANYRAGGPSSSTLTPQQAAIYDQTPYQYTVGTKVVHKITTQEDDSNFSNAFYCLSAIKQFPGEGDGVENYSNYGSFNNPDSENIQNIRLGAAYGTTTWTNNYGAIKWLLNNIYLKTVDATYKDTYLENAFSDYTDEYSLEDVEAFLTDDDIDVVQQYAIWHFTNGNEEPYSRETLPSISIKALVDDESRSIGSDRQKLANHLYQYLIREAVAHQDIYEEAFSYPQFIEDGKVSAATQTDEYYTAGPFQIQSATGTYSNYKVEILNELNEEIDPSRYEVLVKGDGEELVPSTKALTELFDTPFYIRIPAGVNIKNIKGHLTYTINDRIPTVWKTTRVANQTTYQEAVLITREDTENSSSQVFTISPSDYYYLELTKVNSDSNILPGAKFNVKINDEEAVEYTTKTNGKIEITIATTEYTGKDRIEITETKAPTGYAENPGTAVIEVTKSENDEGKLRVDSVTITRPENNTNYPETVGLNTTTKLVSLEVSNTKIEGSYNIQLLKKDKADGTKVLQHAKFQVGDEVYETDVDGLIKVEKEITTVDDETIVVQETEAPANYKKINGIMNLVVAKEIAGNEYKVKSVNVSSQVEGMSAEYNATTNTIEITAEDEALSGQYNFVINKVDSYESAPIAGVPFTVKVNDNEAKTVTTGTNGSISIDPIEITEAGTDTIVVKEVTAPEGYKVFDEDVTITVTKEQGDSAFAVTKVEVSPENSHVNVSFDSSTNTINYTLKNDITDDSYHINLRKLDKSTSSPLANAKFRINGQEYTTAENTGIIEVPATVINATGTDKIQIEEIKAPNGYKKLYGVFELEVVKQVVNKEYSISLNTTHEVEGYTATFDASTKTINVVATDEKNEGEYDLTLIKVDKNNNSLRLPNAEFEINGSKFTTNSYGRITLDPIKITEAGIDEITIKETKAPAGYIPNNETLTIKVNKIVDGSNYRVEIAEQSGSSDMVATVDEASNTIEVVASDEAITGDYGFELTKTDLKTGAALGDVRFKVKFGNHEAESVVTGINGKIARDSISIASEQKETITIEEENAPQGYEKLSGPIVIEVEKDVVDNHYVVTNVTKVSGDSAVVTLDGTTIKVAVTNEKEILGNYNLEIVKTDELGRVVTELETVFDINNVEKKTVQGKVEYADVKINKNNVSTPDTYIIKETKAPDNYSEFAGTIKVTVNKKLSDDEESYLVDSVKMEVTNSEGNYVEDTENISFTQENGTTNIVVKVKNYEKLDMSLRKFIAKVSNEGETVSYETGDKSRVPEVDLKPLDVDGKTTASYNHPKDVVEVKKGDLVTYKIRVYNEGRKDGYVTKVKDYMPDGLEFVADAEGNDIWTYDATTKTVVTNDKYIPVLLTGHTVGAELKYQELTIVCKVLDSAKADINLVNMAEIVEMQYADKTVAKDRDSEVSNFEMPQNRPSYYGGEDENTEDNYIPGQQDDDDFDRIILKDNTKADLSLRKFITAVSKDATFEEGEYLSGDLSRVPVVDKSKLDGNYSTTADYNHTKEAVEVNRKDYVLYTIRVYNEGIIKAQAKAVADYLPEYLEFVSAEETDINSIWNYDEETNSVSTNDKYVPKVLNEYEKGKDLDYQDLQIVCRVKTTASDNTNITNLSEITKYADKDGNDVLDRDSGENNMVKPADYSEYNGGIDENTEDNYIPGQEDEDDFDRVVVKPVYGYYSFEVVKTDETGKVLSNVETEFDITGNARKTKDGVVKFLENIKITSLDVNIEDVFSVKETKAPEGYVGLEDTLLVTVSKKLSDDATRYEIASAKLQIMKGNEIVGEDKEHIKVEEIDGKFKITVTVVNHEKLDFSLRKFVSGISADNATFTDEEMLSGDKSREPKVDLTPLDTKEETTAKYNGPKDPVYVERDDYVLYTIRVYNEGNKPGYVKQVKDYIPEGLEFVEDAKINEIWDYNETTRTITTNDKYVAELIDAHKETEELDYQDLKVVLKVSTDVQDMKVLTNMAEITKITNKDGTDAIDRDSEESNFVYPENPSEYNGGEDKVTEDNYVPGQEDDDDFDKVIVNRRKGEYVLQIVKVNPEGKVIESGNAKFTVNGKDYKSVKGYVNIEKVEINRDNVSKEDIYSIKEAEAPTGYNKTNDTIKIIVAKQITKDNKSYEIGKVSMTYTHEDGYTKDLSDKVEIIKNADGTQVVKIKVANEEIKPSPEPQPNPGPAPEPPSQTTVIPAPSNQNKVVYSNTAPKNTVIVVRNTTNTNTNTNNISVQKATPKTGDMIPVIVVCVVIAVISVNVIQIVITKKSKNDEE